MFRRDFLRHISFGALAAGLPLAAEGQGTQPTMSSNSPWFDVRTYGATGDGHTNDTPAVNRAIEAAAAKGGGTVHFTAGTYACYTIRLRSHITLHLDSGATILAADVPREGTTSGGYDAAEPKQPYAPFQDFGHAHWANSLIHGDGLENLAITGTGLIWGKGLSRGEANEFPLAESPGVGNKAIALRNCRNVTLRDFRMLMGGHFAILLTGTDNVVIDGLTIDTNRDGIDIDCCRNVRVANCAVNSPWDDAICPKSSYALGYARATENVTITNCYVTGTYEYGSLLDGTWKSASTRRSARQSDALSAARSRTEASATSPSQTAYSIPVVALRWRRWTARSSKTLPSPIFPCAMWCIRRFSCAWAYECAVLRVLHRACCAALL